MNTSKHGGFTIIEVTLYLGVSTLLLAGLLTGVALAVQRQRFSDSVSATQGFVQQQFNETSNTINDRADGVACKNAVPGSGDPNVTGTRGASKCLIVGKLLDFSPASTKEDITITTHNVLVTADLPSDYATISGGDEVLFQSKLDTTAVVDPLNDVTFTVPWGAELPQLAYGSSPPAKKIRYIALLRSPVSGSIALYYLNSVADLAPIQAIGGNLNSFESAQAARVCINSKDILTAKALLKISAVGSQDGVTSHFDNDSQKQTWCP